MLPINAAAVAVTWQWVVADERAAEPTEHDAALGRMRRGE